MHYNCNCLGQWRCCQGYWTIMHPCPLQNFKSHYFGSNLLPYWHSQVIMARVLTEWAVNTHIQSSLCVHHQFITIVNFTLCHLCFIHAYCCFSWVRFESCLQLASRISQNILYDVTDSIVPNYTIYRKNSVTLRSPFEIACHLELHLFVRVCCWRVHNEASNFFISTVKSVSWRNWVILAQVKF